MAEKRRILHKLRITEISGVDFPCQEGARMAIMKRRDDEYMERRRLRAVRARVKDLTAQLREIR